MSEVKRHGLFIDGTSVDPISSEYFLALNPATEEVIAEVAKAGTSDVDLAVAAARRAQPAWAALSGQERGDVLKRISEGIENKLQLLASIETDDAGKPITSCKKVDVGLSAHTFYCYGDLAAQAVPETVDAGKYMAMVSHEPRGVVAALVPWNYPLLLASYKIAPALANGNAVVLKPSQETSLSALMLARIADSAGLPAGVLNVVTGSGSEAGAALCQHPGISAITFTGSTETGRSIMQYASKNLAKLCLELGGKSPNIVFADADLEAATTGAMYGFVTNTGQLCTSGSRLLLQESIYEPFLERLIEKTRGMTIGNPREQHTKIGPLISASHSESVLGYIELGRKEGAELKVGGNAIKVNDKGYFLEPAIFAGNNNMRIAREEIFGPVLVVIPFRTQEEAIALANDTSYGLAAGVWTQDRDSGMRVARQLQAGTVWINTYNVYHPAVPYGGFKQSGFGRELGSAGLAETADTKSIWIAK